jgi:hypothetical protein
VPSIHQVNHPGKEFGISFRTRMKHTGDFVFFDGSKTEGIRLWNRCFINEKPNSHKRKFLEVAGKYVDSLKGTPKECGGTLRFWGEYEGHSEFTLLDPVPKATYWDSPGVLHRPFFCLEKANDQNTDPFVFGDFIYYATCKKKMLDNIAPGDLIIFGSEFGANGDVHFYLDTLIVVGSALPAVISGSFDRVYIESTLKRIGLSSCAREMPPIHTGRKCAADSSRFSFIPARLSRNERRGFGRPIVNTKKLGLQAPGARTGAKSVPVKSDEEIQRIWQEVAQSVLNQEFMLGTHVDPLPVRKSLR